MSRRDSFRTPARPPLGAGVEKPNRIPSDPQLAEEYFATLEAIRLIQKDRFTLLNAADAVGLSEEVLIDWLGDLLPSTDDPSSCWDDPGCEGSP